MRVYLPATLDELDHLAADGGPRRAHAVTEALRAALPDEDDEGWEFVAQLVAADESLALLADRPGVPRLRLVLAADVPDESVVPDADPDADVTAVTVLSGVPADAVVCAHVDEPSAAADVVAAVAGDDAAVQRLVDRDLLWYDVS
ncbi:MAG: hypothetical protein B7X40_09160, partial [Cellulomonas sp. 14-74-6]